MAFAIRTTLGTSPRRLSGVLTDPIRGIGCTGVWGDIVTGKNYVWLDPSVRVRRQPKIASNLVVGPEI
ncbi:organic cation/carnitine transporter 3 [Prunus dulcis]|uniref:Organic cation/carnitine transporter 3 n=1 Tax=Prunus dulcis TaxID=3755 RepID=A0A4Y1RJE2_PRUDU|nr:organic cation/carnitine transporter 3 [Prunus dulcis]